MKKKILFFTLCFTFFLVSIGFAYNPLADRRWQHLCTTVDSQDVYCDTMSLTDLDDGFTIWVCYHSRNANPKKERYSFLNFGIGYNRTYFIISNNDYNGNGKLVDSYSRVSRIFTIPPNSIVELILNKYRLR